MTGVSLGQNRNEALNELNKRTNEHEGRGYRGRLEAYWGEAAKGLGPRAIQGGIGVMAVDTVSSGPVHRIPLPAST